VLLQNGEIGKRSLASGRADAGRPARVASVAIAQVTQFLAFRVGFTFEQSSIL
jgi:hypothetical protein